MGRGVGGGGLGEQKHLILVANAFLRKGEAQPHGLPGSDRVSEARPAEPLTRQARLPESPDLPATDSVFITAQHVLAKPSEKAKRYHSHNINLHAIVI